MPDFSRLEGEIGIFFSDGGSTWHKTPVLFHTDVAPGTGLRNATWPYGVFRHFLEWGMSTRSTNRHSNYTTIVLYSG